MNTPLSTSALPCLSDLNAWNEALNKVLQRYSDKDWNYSRISLGLCELSQASYPYVLWIDWIDVRTKVGQAAFKTSQDEITWGGRHSHELGFLELVSLRLNQALSQVSSPDYWHGVRPVVRLQKREELVRKGLTHGFWYLVEEVQGEEFENR